MAIKATPQYEWVLCHAPSPTDPLSETVKIGTLSNAKSRQFEIIRNRAGSASFTLRLEDPMAYQILDGVDLGDVRGTVRKTVRIKRNKVNLWEGPIWGISGSLAQGTMTVNCVGWLEDLQHRILWNTADFSNNGTGVPTDHIVFSLLSQVDSQDIDHRLYISAGGVFGMMPVRNRYYVRGQNLGAAIQELSDIEAGVDYDVDPISRAFNLYSWDSYALREDIVLGYNRGPNNLKDVQWQESADKMCNSMFVTSQGAPVGPIVDSESMNQYGRFEEYNTITGANQDVLAGYAAGEIAIRGRPLVTYTLFPKTRVNQVGAPTLFDDYNIGDAIFFSATKGAFSTSRQEIRVFGASVSLDDAGNETVDSLQTSPTTG